MKIVVDVRQHFGDFCATAERAAEYRALHIDPHLDEADEILFDFTGVRNMNSSFCNSLIGPLATHSAGVIKKLAFCNLRPGLDVLIKSAIETGLVRVDHKTTTA
jgi:hypothetical protein